MAFLPLIPQPNDQLSVSQGNILNNFTILGAIAGNSNAASASINANSGFNFVHLPVQAASPPASASFPAGAVGLYSFLNPTTAQNELYINKTDQATVVQIPATASFLSITSAPAAGTRGWTYLPSGIIIQWDSGTVTGAGPATNWPISFPNQVLAANVSVLNGTVGDVNLFARSIALTNLQYRIWGGSRTVFNSPQATGYQIIAIGY